MTLLNHPSALPAWRRRHARPALRERVVHVDLKGPKFPFGVFKDLLKLYARWGISGVLVEYEHRIPDLPWHRQYPKADRYTRAQVRELTELCRRLGIDYIPKVQTLGHVEYLRRLPGGTARMMENPPYPNQLCPSNERARKYLAELIESVCEVHPHSPRIHVGLDETHQLGKCPVCKKRAAQLGGKMELYLDHARWVTGLVLRRGRVPMMWGDMFLGHAREDLMEKLDPRVVVMPWDYESVREQAPYVLYNGNRPCKAAFRADYTCTRFRSPLPSLPAAGGFADDLSPRELKRLGGIDPKTGMALSFMQGHLMAKVGRELWGTCAADASASGLFRPNFTRGVHNCNQVVRTLLKLGGRGAVATIWARGHSFAPINAIWPLSLHPIAHFAASGWTGKTGPDDLKQRAAEVAAELGMPARIGEWTLDDILWILSNPVNLGSWGRFSTLQTILGLLRESKAKGMFAEGLALSVELEIRWQELLFLVDEARWWHPGRDTAPPIIGNEMRTRIKRIFKDIDRLKPRAARYYTKWVGERDVFEIWWRGLFDVDRELASRAVTLV